MYFYQSPIVYLSSTIYRSIIYWSIIYLSSTCKFLSLHQYLQFEVQHNMCFLCLFFFSNLLTFLYLVYRNFSNSKWLDFYYLQNIYIFTKSLCQHSPNYVANLVPILLALMWEPPSWTQSYKIWSWVHGLAPALVNTPTKCLTHFLVLTQLTCLLGSNLTQGKENKYWLYDTMT